MAPSILGREGFTADSLIHLIQATALNPVLTGSLLYALQHLPPSALSKLSLKTRSLIQSRKANKTLLVLLALGLLRRVNNFLSQGALNNWQSSGFSDVKKELAIVTGGSSGIGEQISLELARKGIKVIILDVQAPKSALPSNIFFFKADVTSSSSIKSVAEAIREKHGEPTILVNNAGIATGTTILDGSEEKVRKVFDINTLSHFILVKEFVPSMVKNNHGHIVTIASMASFNAIGGMVDYACTKASALAFHEGLTQELRGWYNAGRVRTSVVHPSWVRTALTTKLTDTSKHIRHVALDPRTIADAVVDNIVKGNSGRIIRPVSVTVHSNMRSFPAWLQEALRNRGTKFLKAAGEGVLSLKDSPN